MDNTIFHEKHELVYERRRFFYVPELFLWLDTNGNFAPPDMQKKLNNYAFDVDAIPEREMGEKKNNVEAYKIAKKSFEKRISSQKPDYTKWHRIVYKGRRYIFNPSAFGTGKWAEETRDKKPGKYVPSALQTVLNDMAFGQRDLPSLLERVKNANSIEQKEQTKIAIGWLQLKVKQLQQNGGRNIPSLIPPNKVKNGGMYFFTYDAKTKEKLKYWDKFPLIIVLNNTYANGFLGMNLHYLNPNVRLMFLSKLLGAYGNFKNDELTLSNISYQVMKSSGMKYYLPCIKRYLNTHVQFGLLLPAEPHEWIHAAYLPVDNFQKQKNSVVWKDSDNMIRE